MTLVSTRKPQSSVSRTWRKEVVAFVVAACALASLVCLPVWLDPKGLESANSWWVLPAMMYTPAVATMLVIRWMHPRSPREVVRSLGLAPIRPAAQLIAFSVGGIFLLLGTVAAGIGVSTVLGFDRLDLNGFSGYAALLPDTALQAAPIGVLVAVQVALLPAAAVFNGLLAFGEEIGWRGWLLPALQPLGNWPAVLLTGVAWGIWHTPLILLGYNFDRPDAGGVLLMVAGCVAVGSLLGWLRIWSGSIWPCVFGHGAFNAAGGLIFLLSSADANPDLALAGPLGVGTWVVVLLLVAAGLVASRVRTTRSRVPVAAESRRT